MLAATASSRRWRSSGGNLPKTGGRTIPLLAGAAGVDDTVGTRRYDYAPRPRSGGMVFACVPYAARPSRRPRCRHGAPVLMRRRVRLTRQPASGLYTHARPSDSPFLLPSPRRESRRALCFCYCYAPPPPPPPVTSPPCHTARPTPLPPFGIGGGTCPMTHLW